MEALGDRLEARPCSGASLSPHSLPSSEADDDDTDQSLGLRAPQNPPPIVKEPREKLCEHNVPIIHCLAHPPSPPALSRLCSLPPHPSSLMTTPQPAKSKLSHATQTSGYYDEQQSDFDVASEPPDLQ